MGSINNLIQQKISREGEGDKYVLRSAPGETFFNVTKIIDSHFVPFDSWRIASILTVNNENYIHLTAQQLVDQWDKIADHGRDVHKQIDQYLKNKRSPRLSKAKQGIKAIKEIRGSFGNEFFSEVIVFSKLYEIAGTVDLIVKNNKTGKICIFDWKTTKKLYDNKTGFGVTGITKKIRNSNFNKYQLQLSVYNYLLDQIHGIPIEKQFIVHITDNSYKLIDVEYKSREAEKIVKNPKKEKLVASYDAKLTEPYSYSSSKYRGTKRKYSTRSKSYSNYSRPSQGSGCLVAISTLGMLLVLIIMYVY